MFYGVYGAADHKLYRLFSAFLNITQLILCHNNKRHMLDLGLGLNLCFGFGLGLNLGPRLPLGKLTRCGIGIST